MPYDGSVTAQQAEQARRVKLSVPRGRRVPKMLKVMEQVKFARQYRIFNTGPWAHVVPAGSMGTFLIPPCPTEQQCAEAGTKHLEFVEMPRPIHAIMDENIVKSEAEMDRLDDDGEDFAREILGLGRGSAPSDALTKKGCFLAAGDVPTKAELHAANLELRATCSAIVSEIRSVYATDRKLFQQIVRPVIHYRAAEVLNLKNEPWMLDNTPSGQVKCKGCGQMCEVDVAMCPSGHIVNRELYDAFVAEQEAMLKPAARAKAK